MEALDMKKRQRKRSGGERELQYWFAALEEEKHTQTGREWQGGQQDLAC